MAFILTRINVGDYQSWKPMFDQDAPGTRADAIGHRVLRNADDPGEVFVMVEFATDRRQGQVARSCSPRACSTGSKTRQTPRSCKRRRRSSTSRSARGGAAASARVSALAAGQTVPPPPSRACTSKNGSRASR